MANPKTDKLYSVAPLVLSAPDPDAMQARAISAGATQVNAMEEMHGWRIGRVVDPFGHHWEIGRELSA